MTKIFPPEFKQHLANTALKGAFISDIHPVHPRDCHNCGGVGTMVLFLATGGPFREVPTGISHFSAGKWWVGKNVEEICPVCKGSGQYSDYIEQPIRQRDTDLKGIIK